MGAGQIGGLATLLDIDFVNSAGFEGKSTGVTDGHFIVYFLSHAMVFCVGGILEAHVILTPASCVFGEKYKFDVFAGTHTFREDYGFGRKANHICMNTGYNHTQRWESCFTDNMALILVGTPYQFNIKETWAQFTVTRLRYGIYPITEMNANCKYYGWGSRRNGYLIPLLKDLHEVRVKLLPSDHCAKLWNHNDRYVCMQTPACRSSKRGALCPDDLGTMLVCDGYLKGMMTSRLVDRPCGVGFVDMDKYLKFITCGIDGARDVIALEDFEFYKPETSTRQVSQTLPDDYQKGIVTMATDPTKRFRKV